MTVVCALRTDSKARQGCRALQVFALRTNFFVGRGHAPAACRNFRLHTNSFVSIVLRSRGRHAEVVVPYDPSIVIAP